MIVVVELCRSLVVQNKFVYMVQVEGYFCPYTDTMRIPDRHRYKSQQSNEYGFLKSESERKTKHFTLQV